MGLDLDRIKKRHAENRGGKYWQPAKGVKNRIRVFTFEHVVTEADVKAGYFAKEKLGKKVTEFDRSVSLVFGTREDKKPVLATKELIDNYERLASSKNKADKAMADKQKPQRKGLLNVVDTESRPYKMMLWKAPAGVVGDMFAKVCDDDFGEAILGAEGRDYVIQFNPDAPPSKMYTIDIRDKEKSPVLPAELAEKAVDFYAGDLATILGLGGADEAEEDEEEDDEKDEDEEDAKPAKGKAEEADEDDEDEKPAKGKAKETAKSSKSKAKDEDEDDEDDEDDDD